MIVGDKIYYFSIFYCQVLTAISLGEIGSRRNRFAEV